MFNPWSTDNYLARDPWRRQLLLILWLRPNRAEQVRYGFSYTSMFLSLETSKSGSKEFYMSLYVTYFHFQAYAPHILPWHKCGANVSSIWLPLSLLFNYSTHLTEKFTESGLNAFSYLLQKLFSYLFVARPNNFPAEQNFNIKRN